MYVNFFSHVYFFSKKGKRIFSPYNSHNFIDTHYVVYSPILLFFISFQASQHLPQINSSKIGLIWCIAAQNQTLNKVGSVIQKTLFHMQSTIVVKQETSFIVSLSMEMLILFFTITIIFSRFMHAFMSKITSRPHNRISSFSLTFILFNRCTLMFPKSILQHSQLPSCLRI